MGDYSESKGYGAVYPENAIAWDSSRLEPILTPTQVINRYLAGIPLVSQFPDPITKKRFIWTPEIIKDLIEGALNDAEIQLKIDIRPIQRKEKHAFDRNEFNSFGYLKLEHKPCSSIESITINPANQVDIYKVPLEWVETAYLVRGQINMLPSLNTISPGNLSTGQAYSGGAYLTMFSQLPWIPAHWQVIYTSGFRDGMVPRVINDYIGLNVAINILSMLGATFARSNSHSIGIDAVSQSVSTPGPNIFAVRIADMEKLRDKIEGRIRGIFSTKFLVGHI